MASRRSFLKKSIIASPTPFVKAKTDIFSILNKNLVKEVKIGVIGTGSRGQGLIRLINKIDGMKLVAICDTLFFRLDQASKIAPNAKRYDDHKNLLTHKDLSAVIISTPLNTHASIALDSINASVHIYCEKTLVKGEHDIFKLVRAVQKNDKIIFQTSHQYHSSSLYSYILKMIQ